MSEKPLQPSVSRPEGAPLNQALKSEHDPNYGPAYQGTDFVESISVKKEEGRAWPMIWLISFVLCVLITIALLLF